MKKGLVSIIIPCYNSRKYLSRAIESALAQTYPLVEVIVVDDGSTDGSAKVVKRFGERARYHYQPNRGVSAARNAGAKLSEGQFIQFLDADDVLLPGKISRQVEYFSKHPDAELVFSEVMEINDGDEKNPHPELWRTHKAREDFVEALAICAAVHTSSPLMKTEIVQRLGGFPERYDIGEDRYFMMKAALEGVKFHFVPGVGSYYRTHSGQVNALLRKVVEGESRLNAAFAVLFKKYGVTEERRWHALSLGLTRQARSLFLIGELKKAKEFLRMADEVRPATPLSKSNDPAGFAAPEGEWNLSLVYFSIAGDLLWAGMKDEGERLLSMATGVEDLYEKFQLVDEFVESRKWGVVLYPMARAMAAVGQWERYEKIMERIAELHPMAFQPHMDLMKRYSKTGRPIKALRHLFIVFGVAMKRLI